jgi:hypothetical protein
MSDPIMDSRVRAFRRRSKLARKVRVLFRRLGRRWDRLRAPWPINSECHSAHVVGHDCEQCRPSHAHSWKPWMKAPGWVTAGPGVPVRCSWCGARKCDVSDCDQRRHDHIHTLVEGVAFPVIYGTSDNR